MFIETVPNRTSPPAILLRESYRDEAGKAQKRTLANLSKLPASLIAGLKGLLKGGVAILTAPGAASEEGLRIERSLPHGHVAAGLGMLRKIKLDRLLLSTAKDEPSRRCCDLAVGLIVDRLFGVALEAGVRARRQQSDGEQQPGRGSVAGRGGGARGLRGARLAARAAAARRERAGAAASEERHAGALRCQLVVSGGPQMPAGAARLQPRPSAGPAADRLRPALHARGLAGGRGGVRRRYGRPHDAGRPDQEAEAAVRARAGGAGRRPRDADQRPYPRRSGAGRIRLDFVPAQRRHSAAGER